MYPTIYPPPLFLYIHPLSPPLIRVTLELLLIHCKPNRENITNDVFICKIMSGREIRVAKYFTRQKTNLLCYKCV